tara:strand:- start:4364 stop:5044 length:681 start_codon:yes stop_codon:yes gene_type:complete
MRVTEIEREWKAKLANGETTLEYMSYLNKYFKKVGAFEYERIEDNIQHTSIPTIKKEVKQSIERIGFGRRLGAYLLDMLIVGVLGYLYLIFSGLFNFSHELEENLVEVFGAMLWGVYVLQVFLNTSIWALILNSLIEGLIGQSVGKMILGIKVRNQFGKKADLGKTMARTCLKNFWIVGIMIDSKLILGIALLLGVIAFIGGFLVLGNRKLSIHDMLTKTAVYYKS